jgi:uncharacterized protein (TIGR02118 family)
MMLPVSERLFVDDRSITRVFLARRRPDLTIEEFQRHWRHQHAAIAMTFPNLKRYVQNHAVQHDGRLLMPSPGFDVFSELDFESADAMDASWSGPEYAEGEADENNFIDPRWSTVLVGRRLLVGDAAASPRFRLAWLCAARRGDPSDHHELHPNVVANTAQHLLEATGTPSVAAVVATPDLLDRYPPRDYPAMFWVGFDDLGSLSPVMRAVLDVVVSDLGRAELDATTVVEPNTVIASDDVGGSR